MLTALGAASLTALPGWGAAPARAQQWNSPQALDLVARGTARRTEAQADSALASYRTRARGFVFFLAQVGEEGLSEPPRLVKGDQLDVEVYWRAPDRSKQVILGWRDGTFLPTDIDYHRDHLGIVTNDFGNVIRIGEGDEVRDVVHPLSPGAADLYEYAITDSLVIRSPGTEVTVRAVAVRPRDFSRPLVVGTLYMDAATGTLVRFHFSFTPAAYLDQQLEDITITLDNALHEGRYWLPYRQEVELRRRFSWLDFPARGIIRGRWEIGEYDLNAQFPESVFRGPAIAGLRRPDNADSTRWELPFDQAIARVADPLDRQDMEALRAGIERIAGANLLSGLPGSRLAAGPVSELIHVNRVQGLALGIGGIVGVGRNRVQLHPAIGIGTADGRVTGGLGVTVGQGATQVVASASRTVRDMSEVPVITPAVNSILAQEFGLDYGDYVRLDAAVLGIRHRLGGRTTLGLEAAIERSRSLDVAASPATGSYRANPPLGAGTYRIARLRLDRAGGNVVTGPNDLLGSVRIEGGSGPTDYVRAVIEGRILAALGGGQVLARVHGGLGSAGMPAYRSFVLGGRGTLVGEPFRGFGGRRAALAHLEWRIEAPVPAIPLGSFASTGRRMTLAPFVAVGWADRTPDAMPWEPSDGLRPVVGLAAEWFMRLIRVEAGVALRTGEIGVTVDINRDWWGAL